MTCPACTEARRNRYCGQYLARCLGCDLRGMSRSRIADEAKAQRNDQPFRDALAISHPNVEVDVALAAIRDWWRLDHPTTKGAA